MVSRSRENQLLRTSTCFFTSTRRVVGGGSQPQRAGARLWPDFLATANSRCPAVPRSSVRLLISLLLPSSS